jgi:signal transduction histidine kinase
MTFSTALCADTLPVAPQSLVLVVEDDRALSCFIRESLAPEHRVAAFFDEEEGLRHALDLKPDLILGTSNELVQALRARAELATTPIVYLMARDDAGRMNQPPTDGVQDYLTKPFTAAELRARVGNLVSKKRSEELCRSARRAVQARDEVLGLIAHDLRHPLGNILMHAKALQREGAPPELPAKEAAAAIERGVLRMNRLIHDLLDVAQIEAGQLSIHPTGICAERVVAEAVQAQTLLATAAALDLQAEPEPNLPTVFADHDRLLQVFENLIGNALKFTSRGGSVRVGATPKERDVLFWVADTGSGIAPEHIPQMFERFWQARKASRTGAGLGLYIVKAIVEAHGGHVWAESTPGQGSTFFFTVPSRPQLP